MSSRYPGLKRAAEICQDLAARSDAKIAANPNARANRERRARSSAYRNAARMVILRGYDDVPGPELGS